MLKKLKKSEDFGKYKVKGLTKETIEAEEVFLDSEKLKKSPESEREKLEFPIRKEKVYFIYFAIIVLLCILFAKAVNLQIIKGDYWRSLAEENRIRAYPIKALRGIIYDTNNKPLVSNEPRFDLTIVPTDLLKQEENLKLILNFLAETLKKPKDEIENLLKENANLSIPMAIAEDISRETALILENKFTDNPVFSIEINSKRNYVNGPSFSHVLGYIGRINPDEHQQHPDYMIDDYIGKDGIELYYENILRGALGEQLIEVDHKGEIKNIFARKEPMLGKNITLSIDSDLQKKLYTEIKQMLLGLSTKKAAGIAIDPNNGKVLALVSFPEFDNNKFIQGMTKKDFEKIIYDSSEPLFNRAISGTYPPGSTIKPLIAVGALTEKTITPNQIIVNCTGSITVANKYYPGIFYTFRDWKAHGPTNLIKAIAESCNVCFYALGGGYGNINGLGIEKIGQYLKKFGLGKILGIDLPREAEGLVPSETWKRETKNEEWYIGDTYNVSIGQGDVMATPLQISMATTVIANGGTLFEPQLIDKIDNDSVLPQILKENIADKDVLDIVKRGMREAVISGSAWQLYDLGIKVAGKTGTAQAPGGKTPHGWFTSFAPYEKPEIVLTILIENGGEGSAVAVPVAKEVLGWYFNR